MSPLLSPVNERLHRRLGLPLQIAFRIFSQSCFIHLVRIHHQEVAKVKLAGGGNEGHVPAQTREHNWSMTNTKI